MNPIIDITQRRLETKRLMLRPWEQSDLKDFFAYASVNGVGEMAGWPHHESIETTQMILNDFLEQKNVFALEDKETGRVIGSLGLHDSWANEEDAYKKLVCKEIGYVLAKDYWGKELMPEAVQAVIEACFLDWGIDVLTCGHYMHNAQSKRVIEKCGFTFVKQGIYGAEQLGKSFVSLKYMLRREEYKTRNSDISEASQQM